jgi:hypothetical protein
MTYDVSAYKTKRDYDSYVSHVVIDGITNKKDALREGRFWQHDHEVVKVQSSDREYIAIFDKTSPEGIK